MDERAGDEDLEDNDTKEGNKFEKDNPLKGQEDKLDAEMRGKEEEEEEGDGRDPSGRDQEEDKAKPAPEDQQAGQVPPSLFLLVPSGGRMGWLLEKL